MITGLIWSLGLKASSGSLDKCWLSVVERALTTHDSSGWCVWSRARDHGEQSQNFRSNYSGVTAVMSHGGDAAAGPCPPQRHGGSKTQEMGGGGLRLSVYNILTPGGHFC